MTPRITRRFPNPRRAPLADGEQAVLGVVIALSSIGVGLFVVGLGPFISGMAWCWAMGRVLRWADGA